MLLAERKKSYSIRGNDCCKDDGGCGKIMCSAHKAEMGSLALVSYYKKDD